MSSFFADIFRNNTLNNGLLPVQVSEAFLQKLLSLDNMATVTVDLVAQTISIDATGEKETFAINGYKKTCMINGFDDIDYLLSLRPEIEVYERSRS